MRTKKIIPIRTDSFFSTHYTYRVCNSVCYFKHTCFPGAIGPNQHIQPRTKFKVGVGKNGEILEVEAL